jgi:hypothetical protein
MVKMSRLMPPTPVAAPLVGFNGARVVVALDLEGAGPAIADVHQAGVLLTRFGQQLRAGARQRLQQADGVLVGAVLAPHGTVDAEFREVGRTAQDLLIFWNSSGSRPSLRAVSRPAGAATSSSSSC